MEVVQDKALLIVDSGATKATWCFLQAGKKRIFETPGINPYFQSNQEIKDFLRKQVEPEIPEEEVRNLFFYGTGMANDDKAASVKGALSTIFENSIVEVNHDLTGAARALCLHGEGLACILGTGSGACYYDGKEILESSLGLGYVLGDEGSGSYLGKKLLQKYLYKQMNPHLKIAFDERYHISKADILNKVYQGNNPNRYLASFAIFLSEHRGDSDIEEILGEGLKDFFKIHVESFEQSRHLPIHFVGGIAEAFKDVLQFLCEDRGMKLGRVLKTPMAGLMEYHQGK